MSSVPLRIRPPVFVFFFSAWPECDSDASPVENSQSSDLQSCVSHEEKVSNALRVRTLTHINVEADPG